EDPFAINDFGFDKAMRELEQLTANIPAFDAMPPLDMPSQDAWDTPKNELDSGVPDTEIGQNTDAAFSTLPQWDTPMSYPISEYRSAADNRKPMPYSLDTAFHDTLTDINTLPDTPVRRKSTYTNKLLTQVPPQLDTLMTDEPVRKMGSKPHRLIGQATIVPVDDEPLALPVIPKAPPPNAQSILVESTPYYQADESGLDKMAVRKAKRHQLQYLIERGMSPKEIAAHLEMPVGEVELIFSLHKRLTGEAAMTTRQPLTDSQPHINAPAHTGTPMRRPRIIAAENVIVRGDEGRQG
ncbi:MAG: DUF2802 domain-containing protein, partial [Planctomycetaceae bacterium]|nr:DUF2802 domain-containing protein [Planctomycetaceae bacterium]